MMLKPMLKNQVEPFALAPAFTTALLIFMLLTFPSALVGCKHKHHHHKPHAAIHLPQDTHRITLFFSKKKGSDSVIDTVVRELPKAEQTVEPLKIALTELFKGPSPTEQENGFYSEIPDGTKLLAFTVNKNQLTVDLSSHFSSGGGSNSMIKRLEEVRQTIFSVDHQHSINITIEGKPLNTLGGEGLEVDDSLTRKLD